MGSFLSLLVRSGVVVGRAPGRAKRAIVAVYGCSGCGSRVVRRRARGGRRKGAGRAPQGRRKGGIGGSGGRGGVKSSSRSLMYEASRPRTRRVSCSRLIGFFGRRAGNMFNAIEAPLSSDHGKVVGTHVGSCNGGAFTNVVHGTCRDSFLGKRGGGN